MATNIVHCVRCQISAQEIQKAESYFPVQYIEKLRSKSTYTSSIVARYLISQIVAEKFGVLHFLPQIDASGKPIFESDVFWSIAHSQNHIFVGVTKGIPIGLDIEQTNPRDTSLFSKFTPHEWRLFDKKNWKSFYTLWTAKEAIIKLKRGNLDDISTYQIQAISQNKVVIGGLTWEASMSLFGHPDVSIYSNGTDKIRYAIALGRGNNFL